MKPKVRAILGCAVCVFGAILLLVVVIPYPSADDAASTQGTAVSPANRTSIRFSEKTVRLVPVHSGEISSGFVLVENTGNNVISDVAIKAGCRCSDVKSSKTEMNPGETIRIDFSIDTRGKYEDSVEHFLFTYSENEENLFDVFYVTVPILAPGQLVAEPSSLQFNPSSTTWQPLGNF